MRLFIAGGSGMVGRNLLEHPAIAGHEVVTPARRALDLLDRGAVEAAIGAARPDVVIHAAGVVGGIQANLRAPVRFLVDNATMGFNVVLAARAAGVRRLVNLGSSCMYPRDRERLPEELLLSGELEPTNEGYAISKIAVARLCDYVRRESPEMSYVTIIPPNLYGRWDSYDPERSHLVAAALRKVHEAHEQRRPSVEVWGDGSARREFMDCADLAGFLLGFAERIAELPGTLNVGVGDDHSVDEYYQTAMRVVGYRGALVHDLAKPVGMRRKLLDVSRAAALGWRATTSLEHGMRRAYAFFREHQ